MDLKVRGAVALAALVAAGAGLGAAPNRNWHAPECTAVQAPAGVSFTTDEGATYAANPTILPRGQGTFGIAALESPNVLLAEYRGAIYRSTDAGCRWREYTTVGTSPIRMSAGVGDEAWAWDFFASPQAWWIDANAGKRGRAMTLPPLGANVLTLRAVPGVAGAVRAVADDGSLYEWRDGDAKWAAIGRRAPVGALAYFADIDPVNPDHAVIGEATNGVWTTTDGGATWTNALGLSSTGGPRNSFNGVVSPADPSVVYVMSLDLDESDSGAPSNGRHVYRSSDGGFHFAPVVDQGGDIVLTNGPTMAAHPTDANVAYFSFGSKSFDPFGIRLYRYDHASGQTTSNLSNDYFEIRSMAFNPADAGVMYMGFEGE